MSCNPVTSVRSCGSTGFYMPKNTGMTIPLRPTWLPGLLEFALSFDPQKDRVWVVEREGQTIGSIAIVQRPREEAQLRWFLIHPDSRGLGLGRTLLTEAVQFCKEQGYHKVFLWTIRNLTVATHLYRSCGFEKTNERIHPLWGKMVHEERYDLLLSPESGLGPQVLKKF